MMVHKILWIFVGYSIMYGIDGIIILMDSFTVSKCLIQLAFSCCYGKSERNHLVDKINCIIHVYRVHLCEQGTFSLLGL